MIEKLDDGQSLFFLTLYALAAISGSLGGCVVWSYYTRRSKRAMAFFLAYSIIGLVFGILSCALMLKFSDWQLHELVMYSMAAGFGGTTAVFGINWGAGVAFKWKNLEVKFTVREPFEDRRGVEKEGEDG